MAKQVAQILNPALAVFVAMSTKFKREKEINTKKNSRGRGRDARWTAGGYRIVGRGFGERDFEGKERERTEEEGRGRKGRKGTQPVDDVNTPVSESILKAVVASQDLGAAGTEFERSLIVSPFHNNIHFLPFFLIPFLSPLFSPLSMSILLTLSESHFPLFFQFFFLPSCTAKEATLSDLCFVRCFSRSAFFGGMRNQIHEIDPIGDQLISPPIFPDPFTPPETCRLCR